MAALAALLLSAFYWDENMVSMEMWVPGNVDLLHTNQWVGWNFLEIMCEYIHLCILKRRNLKGFIKAKQTEVQEMFRFQITPNEHRACVSTGAGGMALLPGTRGFWQIS